MDRIVVAKRSSSILPYSWFGRYDILLDDPEWKVIFGDSYNLLLFQTYLIIQINQITGSLAKRFGNQRGIYSLCSGFAADFLTVCQPVLMLQYIDILFVYCYKGGRLAIEPYCQLVQLSTRQTEVGV